MGQAHKRFYHTQEIAHAPRFDEWEVLGNRTVEVEETDGWQGGGTCVASVSRPWGAACCAVEDSTASVEEVLVVHHEALRKVNFLLRVDELSGCDLPTVPECVIAAKRAELLKQRNDIPMPYSITEEETDSTMRETTEQDGPISFRVVDSGVPAMPDPAAGMDEEEDMGPSFTIPSGRGAGIGMTSKGCPSQMRSSGMTPQPSMTDDVLFPDDCSTEDELFHGNCSTLAESHGWQ